MLLLVAALAAPVRGMTISTPTYGPEWGSPALDATLDHLKTLGVSWISYHPYARVRRDGTVEGRVDPPWITHPVAAARSRGIQVMVKPHLAYWGSGFDWRGSIRFDDPEAEARFYRTYTAWITAVAARTAEADAFAVGTELKGLSGNEAAWREVIASVRAVHPGHLTYAANWDEVQHVGFWDALDAVGVQAYFPILTVGAPTPATVQAGWDQVFAGLRPLAARTGKPIVFTELGYDASPNALAEPWSSGQGAPELQELALREALRAIDREPTVVGAFLWKWFPGEVQRGDFRMSEPRLQAVIREVWLRDGALEDPGLDDVEVAR